jgi:acyl carrier protein
MNRTEIRTKIKQIIGSISGIDPRLIADEANLRADLNLDSLSLLEIGVDVDLAFQLNLPDETYRGVEDLPSMVALVEKRQAEIAATATLHEVAAG